MRKIIIVHPGTQHAFRLANAVSVERTDNMILFFSWLTLPKNHILANFNFFRKRIKPINKGVIIKNFLLFEVFLLIHLKINSILNIQSNNPYYFWQIIFGWFLLPVLYFNKKSSVLVTFETCGWPLVKYAKKWKIPVIMDFPSISHELAESLGIGETDYGKKIKSLERQQIDYAISCSNFAKESYNNITSAKKHFSIWLGTDFRSDINNIAPLKKGSVNICCLANTEQRKGIDILLESFNRINKGDIRLHLIGNISPSWVANYCNENNLSLDNIILTGPKAQQDLKEYLLKEHISLHILPSRFDSFGMVVPETMALGIPNIVSPYVGAGEMLQHGIDGYVMNTLSADELTKFIYEYINLSDECKVNLSMAALKKAEQMTWGNYNERIKVIFEEILLEI